MKNYTVQAGDTLCGISKQFGISKQDLIKINNLENDTLRIGQILKIPTTQVLTYTVKKGDDLYSIANSYQTTVEDITNMNQLKSPNLYIGQTLIIPITGSNNSLSTFTYTVQANDNLYDIAKKYNTTVEDIKKLNNLSSNALSINQKLLIPTTEEPPEVEYQNYIVRKGDSIYSIAENYQMTPEELMEINNLTSPILSVGQILEVRNTTPLTSSKIKECFGTNYEEPTYETHEVKQGDNLYDIAKKYNTTVENLMKLNNLTTSTLSLGQILKIKEKNK